MAGISSERRDLERVRVGLESWLLETVPDAHAVRINRFGTSEGNGFSNETLTFDAEIGARAGDYVTRLVARLPPSGEGIFASYDLELQCQVQQLVWERGIPVAKPVGRCSDDRWIGTPFMVMEFVDGRVPPNQPPYNVSGWLVDEPVPARRDLFLALLAAMSSVHRIDTAGLDLAFLTPPAGPGLAAELSLWCEYVLWACDGSPPPQVSDLMAWCHSRLPAVSSPDVVCWGDARLGNAIFAADGTVAALLDWEMATLGPCELDVGWFSAFRRQVAARTGRDGDCELEGFPSRSEMIDRYEQGVGRGLCDLEWFEAFAMLKLAGMVVSTQRIVRGLGLTDHFIVAFPAVERWVLDLIEGQ